MNDLWPNETPKRTFVLQRRFLRPEGAEFWAYTFNNLNKDPRAKAVITKTWYGSKVTVWLDEEA